MPAEFIPARDADLVNFSSNFSTKITATPTDYGLTAAQATTNGNLASAFSAAYALTTDPATRTTPNILAKNTARRNLVENIRLLARIVQATPTVTESQIAELGLTVRDVQPSPIPVPTVAPAMEILSVVGRTVTVHMHEAGEPQRRGKPEGVAGATVFSFVGTSAPADIADWKFEGSTTRTTMSVVFPATVAAGAQVWLTSFWYNPRAQSGPACSPITTNVALGVSQAA